MPDASWQIHFIRAATGKDCRKAMERKNTAKKISGKASEKRRKKHTGKVCVLEKMVKTQ